MLPPLSVVLSLCLGVSALKALSSCEPLVWLTHAILEMWTAFGIMLGTVINVAVFYHAHNWRLMLGLPAIPAVPLIGLIYLCPESPRWCMKKGRYVQAWDAMMRLRFNPIQVARDIYYIHCQLEIEREVLSQNNYITRAIQLFTIPRVRRATLAAFTVMLAQQMCGKWMQIDCICAAWFNLTRLSQVSTSSPSTRLPFSRRLARMSSTPCSPHLVSVSSTGCLPSPPSGLLTP